MMAFTITVLTNSDTNAEVLNGEEDNVIPSVLSPLNVMGSDRSLGEPFSFINSKDRFVADQGSDVLLTSPTPSRESDTEKETDAHDYANGSRITSSGEKISGTLTYDPSGTSDFKDWYKLSEDDVDPSPGASQRSS